MKYNRSDHLSLNHVIAIGRKQDIFYDDQTKSWQVYVRLLSGVEVVLAYGGTERQAQRCLEDTVTDLVMGGLRFIRTLDNAVVNTLFVERMFVDAQGDNFCAFAQDVTGRYYTVDRGTERACNLTITTIAQSLASFLDQEQQTGEEQGSNEET